MINILDKISSYNLFNYLLPGVLFAVIVGNLTIYPIIQDDIVTGIFVYYFIGLVVSRFGSLCIEPALKKLSFLKFAKYKDYISASKEDKNIEVLSEVNNVYRTFSSMFILILLLKIYESIEMKIPAMEEWSIYIAVILLTIMFLYSYKKQTDYIRNRVAIVNE